MKLCDVRNKDVSTISLCTFDSARMLIILFLILFLPTATLAGESDSLYLDGYQRAELNELFQKRLDSLKEQFGFPGATAAYSLRQGYHMGFATGMADLELSQEMRAHTLMYSASIGKVAVGALIVRLAEEGALKLDDTIYKHLDNKKWITRLPNADKITIRHLLSHSSGLRDHLYTDAFSAQRHQLWEDPEFLFTPEELVGFILDKETLFKPGEGFHYTDTGFIILGLIAEELTKKSFYTSVQEKLYGPAGIQDTMPATRRLIHNTAQGYGSESGDSGLPKRSLIDKKRIYHPGNEHAGGGFISTATDLVKWADALFGDNVAAPDYMNKVLNSAVLAPKEKALWGLGVKVVESDYGCAFEHGGWAPNYLSHVRYYRDSGVAVSIMINSDDPDRMKAGPPAIALKALADIVHDFSLHAMKEAADKKQLPCT